MFDVRLDGKHYWAAFVSCVRESGRGEVLGGWLAGWLAVWLLAGWLCKKKGVMHHMVEKNEIANTCSPWRSPSDQKSQNVLQNSFLKYSLFEANPT